MSFDFEQLEERQQIDILQKLSDEISGSRWDLMQYAANNRTRYLSVILEDIYQAHNAGAVVRSCDGFGIQDVNIIEIRNKLKLAQTTVAKGAHKWLDFHYYNKPETDNTEACFQALKAKGYKIAALNLHTSSTTLDEVPLDQPLAIALGTEKLGLTKRACELADYHIKIPMYGFTESFNLSVCSALSLQTLRKRLEQTEMKWKLGDGEKRELLFLWLQKCLKHWERLI